MSRAASEQCLVSVVIPAFNCANTIAPAVRSCLEQTHPNVEVIVVNDGSTDGTRDLLGGLGSDVQVIDQKNAGLAAARSVGQSKARGDYIAWMDGDDVAHPERLRTQLAALAALPRVDLVCSDFRAFKEPGEILEQSYIRSYYPNAVRLVGPQGIFRNTATIDSGGSNGRVIAHWGKVYDALLAGNFVHPPTVLLRRSLLDRVGGFDTSLRYSSDYEYLLRASQISMFAFLEASLLDYRLSAIQMSRAAEFGLLQIETAQILDKVLRTDPCLDRRRQDDLRRYSAAALLSAAEGLARTGNRIEAFRLFSEAQSHCFLPVASCRTLARIAMPDWAASLARHMRYKEH